MSTNATNAYAAFFKGWNAKVLGPKPTAEQLDTIHKLGARPGKQALANAMFLRDGGATAAQIVMACGAPQLNKMRELVARKLVKRDMNMALTDAGHTVYKITLAAAGEKALAKAAEAAKADASAKPAKAPRKRKVKADAPQAEAQQPVAPAPADAEQQPAPQG